MVDWEEINYKQMIKKYFRKVYYGLRNKSRSISKKLNIYMSLGTKFVAQISVYIFYLFFRKRLKNLNFLQFFYFICIINIWIQYILFVLCGLIVAVEYFTSIIKYIQLYVFCKLSTRLLLVEVQKMDKLKES